MTLLPPETPECAARREALYRPWVTADEIAAILGVDASEVTQMRRSNELLAAWVHERQEYRFPLFQLSAGQLNPRMPLLLDLLPDVSRSGWGRVEWFISPHALLLGARPADLVAEGRFDEVLAAAQEEWNDPSDGSW